MCYSHTQYCGNILLLGDPRHDSETQTSLYNKNIYPYNLQRSAIQWSLSLDLQYIGRSIV